jgi:cytochrome P450
MNVPIEQPTIADFEELGFNPFTAAKELGGERHVTNPHEEYHRLRAISPVYQGELKLRLGLSSDLTLKGHRHFWILAFDEAKKILTDPLHFSATAYMSSVGLYFGKRAISIMDDPEHARVRKIMQPTFGPKAIKRWNDELIPRTINTLLDGFENKGRIDLVDAFTLRFPFHFIHELMALPEEHREKFHKLAFGQLMVTFDQKHGLEAVEKIRDYVTQLVAYRRATGNANDFVTALATHEVDGEPLDLEVIISFFRQLMNAGGETSYNGFSNLMVALLTHPDQLEAVRQDRSLVPTAIEEALRWEPPVCQALRTPRQPVEIAGVVIEPGDLIAFSLSAINRDPAEFDEPDRYNVFRGTKNHVAFSLGSHMCIGQHLARVEMACALNILLDRLPKLRLDTDYPEPAISGFMLRGPESIKVRFD